MGNYSINRIAQLIRITVYRRFCYGDGRMKKNHLSYRGTDVIALFSSFSSQINEFMARTDKATGVEVLRHKKSVHIIM